MYDLYKSNSAACSNACRPIVIHSVLMSIIFEHYKQLIKLMEQKKAKDKEMSSSLDTWTTTATTTVPRIGVNNNGEINTIF